MMRKSRVLKKMRAGEVALCTKCNLSDPREAEIAANAGFDCIWICLEHCPTSIASVGEFVRAAKAFDCDVLTRVERGSYSDLIRPFEADSTGIMVPHLMSLEEAKKIVYYTKFNPIGRRPIDGGNSDTCYGDMDMNDYIKEANEERFVIVQIEDPEPLDELDEIAALPGIDMIFFGPADFSHGIGKPFQWNAPEIQETRKRIADAAKKYGKFAGTTGGIGDCASLRDMGYNFICAGADVVALNDYFKNTYNGLVDALK